MLRFIEGFETKRDGTYLNRHYATVVGSAGSHPTGRKGGFCAASTTLALTTKPFPTAATVIVGAGFFSSRTTAVGSSSAGVTLSDASGSQLEFAFQPATATVGQFIIQVKRGATILATTPELQAGAWHYFEFKATIDVAAGAYEIRRNGVNILSDTGINTSNQGAGTVDRCTLSWIGSWTVRFDDIYICDDSGGLNDDFLGDRVVLGALPTIEGNRCEWLPSAGVDNAELVNDSATAVEDAKYVRSNVPGEVDLYDYAAIPLLGPNSAVAGIMVTSTVAMQASGTRTVRPIVRSGGSEAVGVGVVLSDMTIRNTSEVFDLNPVSAAPWTKATLEASEVGLISA